MAFLGIFFDALLVFTIRLQLPMVEEEDGVEVHRLRLDGNLSGVKSARFLSLREGAEVGVRLVFVTGAHVTFWGFEKNLADLDLRYHDLGLLHGVLLR